MKSIAACLFALISAAPVLADPLSQADRQALIEALDALKNAATDHATTRLGSAASAFNAGVASADAATELYLRCVEKVDFEERDRKSSEFREWKKRHKDRLDDEGHGLALRHQLQWTVLTMKAASDPAEARKLAPKVLDALEAIFRTPEDLRGHVGILTQSVDSTVFARAYGLTGYKVEGWPMSPLSGGNGSIRVDGAFQQLIFPACRAAGDADALRAAWKRRIQFEEVARGFWSRDSTEEGESPERDKFLAETRPGLEWDMEEDLFKAGDEKRAAVALLKHLETYIQHSQARDWEARFRLLVDPPPVETGADDG